MHPFKNRFQVFSPLTWPIWLALGVLWLLTHLPYRIQLSIGSELGRILYLFPSKLKEITRVNIALCFSEFSQKQQMTLMKENFRSLGMGIMETAMAWWTPDAKLEKRLRIIGLEHAEAALAKQKGVILLSPHFICLEMMGRLISMRYRFASLYRPHKKPLIAYLHTKFRSRYNIDYIPRHKMRLFIEALRQNQPVWYAYDVDGGKQRSVFAPFFGIQTATLTAVSRLTQMTGALVVPVHFYRRKDRQGYELHIAPALETFPSNDEIKDATRLNHALETAIREAPEQYIWQYKRFKTRPKGETRIY